MNAYPDWLGLREIDAAAGTGKGAAFRVFKRMAAALREGTDYVVLRGSDPDPQIDALRAQQRLYAGSVHAILLEPAAARRVIAALVGDGGGVR